MFDHIKPVRISSRAAEEILRIFRSKKIPAEYGLRLGVRGAGCGVTPIIGFDKSRPSDLTYQDQGITIHIDKRHTMHLIGKEVDFYEGADAKGFMFVDKATTELTTPAA